jgi:hypothetical protein
MENWLKLSLVVRKVTARLLKVKEGEKKTKNWENTEEKIKK